MPRLVEIALFLLPFAGFVVWRLVFPSPTPPLWLVGGLAGTVVVLLAGLIYAHQRDAADVGRAYVPATLQDGRVVPGHAAAPP